MSNISYNILADELRFPEGPAIAPDGSIWAVELKGESLVRYRNKNLDRFKVGGAPNGIAIDSRGMIWFCDSIGNSIRCFDPVSQACESKATHIKDEILNKPNDLCFDDRGNLLFTCPGNSRTEPTGYVCTLSPNGAIKKIADNKYFPNGLALTPDGRQLIIAETYRHRLWIGDWDAENIEWNNQRVWCETGGPNGPGGPDGISFDEKGNLFVAVYGTGLIKVVNSNGEIFSDIRLPGMNPTNCVFDSSGEYGLIVTEAEDGILYNIKFTQFPSQQKSAL